MHFLTAMVGGLLLAGPVWAQGGAAQDKGNGRIVPDAIGFRQHGLIDDRGRPTQPGSEAKMTAAQKRSEDAARNEAGPPSVDAPMRGDHLFTPSAYLRPRRLAPGQRGGLHVVVTLGEGHNVVVPGSVAELRLAAGSKPLTFGKPVLVPPTRGQLASKFSGQLVYEDSLTFKVPITIAVDAVHGDYPVRGVVRLFLHDGLSGDPQGLFVADVKGCVAVGAALPTAKVHTKHGARDGEAATGDSRADARTIAVPAMPVDRADSEHDVSMARSSTEQSPPEPAARTGEGSPPKSASRALDWALALGALGLVGLLLWFRRRR